MMEAISSRMINMLLIMVLAGASTIMAMENVEVNRIIDLTSHIVNEEVEIKFKSDGSDVYKLAYPADLMPHLSDVAAKMNAKKCLVTKETKLNSKGFAIFTVMLPKELLSGKEASLKITSRYTRLLTPFPKEIRQNENQLVVFEGNHKFISPYPTKSESLKIKLPESSVESFSMIEPSLRKGNLIVYGPYLNTKPFDIATEKMRIHFPTNAPFVTLTTVVKEIEVSMWGRVSVEEVYDLLHTGAKLKGGFSRLDYQLSFAKKKAAYDSLTATLPVTADNVYYRDQIGNITTSRFRREAKVSKLEFKPRFPIFGGWKTQWYMGYTVPTESVMMRTGNTYKLSVDFGTPIRHAAVDDLTVKIILPEGSKNIKVSLPFDIDSEQVTTRQTYLDTPMFGRPVTILMKKNVVDVHNVPFSVTFDFDQTFMLHEPVLLISAYMTVFVLAMIVLRVDLRIAPSAAAKKKKVE